MVYLIAKILAYTILLHKHHSLTHIAFSCYLFAYIICLFKAYTFYFSQSFWLFLSDSKCIIAKHLNDTLGKSFADTFYSAASKVSFYLNSIFRFNFFDRAYLKLSLIKRVNHIFTSYFYHLAFAVASCRANTNNRTPICHQIEYGKTFVFIFKCEVTYVAFFCFHVFSPNL